MSRASSTDTKWRAALRRLAPLPLTLTLAGFEALSRTGVLPLPPPSDIATSFYRDVQGNAIWLSVWETIKEWALGMSITSAVGIPLGVLLGSSKLAYHVSHLTVESLRSIPSLAALPFLVLIYGVGIRLAVVMIILAAIWPLLIQTTAGVRDVDPVMIETARVFGLPRLRRFGRVVLPAALPYIGTGMRLAGVYAMIIAVATSLFAGGGGVGAAIGNAMNSGAESLMYARIFVASLLGLIVTIGLERLEAWLLHWHPSNRAVP